jgi:RimJ/RimL family protein N-acetyltransferase
MNASGFQAIPLSLDLNIPSLYKVKRASEAISRFSSAFTAYETGEEGAAFFRSFIVAPGTFSWEVWSEEEGLLIDFVGILSMSRVVPETDAVINFFFFDEKLSGKQDFLREWLRHLYKRFNLHRLSLEIPANAYSMISHAHRHLGFSEEGVQKEALKVGGSFVDKVLLGRLNDA